MKTEEVKVLVVDVCQKVVVNFSKEIRVEKENLNIRIDMKDTFSKPVFGLFEGSKFLTQKSLKDVIHAGGGTGLSMVLSMYIRNIIKDIFSASLKRFELTDTKDLFVLLYIKAEANTKTPMIAIYVKGELMDAVEVGEIIGGTTDNIQT